MRWVWAVMLVTLGVGIGHPVRAQSPAEEEEPTVTGIEAARPGGGFLGLAVEGNGYVLRFYDEEKTEIAPDAARATARWNSPQKAGQQRVVLARSGNTLRSPPRVRPPLVFIAFISLFTEEGELIESHSFNLRSLPPG